MGSPAKGRRITHEVMPAGGGAHKVDGKLPAGRHLLTQRSNRPAMITTFRHPLAWFRALRAARASGGRDDTRPLPLLLLLFRALIPQYGGS